MTQIPLTVGVEEEFAVVDARRRDLVGRSNEILARLPEDVGQHVEHELKTSQIETATPVCADLRELRSQLVRLRSGLVETARKMGCSIMAAGTHPTSSWQDQVLTEKASYEHIDDEYGRLAQEQLVFGCHVHVGVEDPDLRIAAIDRVRPWLAPLLALTANSPYWEGTDTDFASYRYVIFSRWPTFVTPDPLTDWATYQQLVDDLITSGAIDSPKRLYWTVRPSNAFPTIEFRIADVCRTVSEAVMVAGLTRALVATAIRDAWDGAEAPEVRPEVLRMAEWQAARHGLGGELLDPLNGTSRPAAESVAALLDHVGASLDEADGGDGVRGTVADVLRAGNGAIRQRRIHDERGMDAVLAQLELQSASPGVDEPAEQTSVRRAVD